MTLAAALKNRRNESGEGGGDAALIIRLGVARTKPFACVNRCFGSGTCSPSSANLVMKISDIPI